MSRTYKDAPSVRRARKDRKFAEAEAATQSHHRPIYPRWDDLAEAATQGDRSRIRPTAEQRILDLLAQIPPLRPDPDHAALAGLVEPADWTRPMPADRTPTQDLALARMDDDGYGSAITG